MQSEISSKWSLSIVIIVGIVFSSMIIFSTSTDSNQISQNLIDGNLIKFVQSIAFPEQASFGLPVRLKIPIINVDSAIEQVGLTLQGAVGAPKDFANVAWLELGPRPGEDGSAIITGHYGWKNGKPSVFDNLYKLRKGDKLYIEDDKGIITSFIVRENRRYDPKAEASDVFSSNDGKPQLNLITCEGVWDEVSKTYSQRLVVFADKE